VSPFGSKSSPHRVQVLTLDYGPPSALLFMSLLQGIVVAGPYAAISSSTESGFLYGATT
jgi:hypothetical protein